MLVFIDDVSVTAQLKCVTPPSIEKRNTYVRDDELTGMNENTS